MPDKRIFFLFLTVIISFGNCSAVSTIKCKDDVGRDVDWFLAYKLPKIKTANDLHAKSGLAYSYILPNSPKWQKSEKSVNDSNSMIGRSIQQLFSPDANIAYILYNDQPPTGSTAFGNGHTKGILLANLVGGIWLQHSVPHFVSLERNSPHYSYPFTGLNNGQMFFCFSLTLPQLDSIGRVLMITKPHMYNHSIPDSFKSVLPTLEQVVANAKDHSRNGKLNEFDPTFSNSIDADGAVGNGNTNRNAVRPLRLGKSNDTHEIFQLKTSSRIFTVFAKAPNFFHEVYSDWIAPQFHSGLDVQSWLNGHNAYPSNCTSTSLPVYNIENKMVSGYNFSTHNDHSKWAISIDVKTPWVCNGDLNRMEAQTHRGGAIVCFEDKNIWNSFRASVLDTQPCQHPNNAITSEKPRPSQKDKDGKATGFHRRAWRKMKALWQRMWNSNDSHETQ